MADDVKRFALSALFRVALPPLLGALGAIIATAAPAYYDAVCRAGGL